MKIPNADRAIIDFDKLVHYLLDIDHPQGGPKARLLISLGYATVQWQQLEHDLRRWHLTEDYVATSQSRWGTRYEIVAPSPAHRAIPSCFAASGKLILGRTYPD